MRTLTLRLLWMYILILFSIHHYSRFAGAVRGKPRGIDPKRDSTGSRKTSNSISKILSGDMDESMIFLRKNCKKSFTGILNCKGCYLV